MADRHSDVERAFRGALLRVSNEMGEETWKNCCFLYAIPERVREGSRSDALDHLIKTGELSSERPEEFAKQLHLNLSHTDLAEKFTGFLSEDPATPAVVETREGANRRRANDDDRRHAKHYSQVLELPDSDSPQEVPVMQEGTDGQDPITATDEDLAPFQRPRATNIVGATRGRSVSNRHDSINSRISSRSSGYFSQRDSVLSMQSHYDASPQPDSPEEEQEREGEGDALDRQDSFPRSASFQSSSSSSMEEEFRSVHSSSLSSISTFDCDSLPREFTAEARSEYESPTSLTPTPETRKRGGTPNNMVASPTQSTVRKTDTIVLKCCDIISDIDQRLRDKVYCSLASPERSRHGIDFKMKFSPINPQDTGGCSLNVEVRSHMEKKLIPPLDISVCVVESSHANLARDLSHREEKNRLAHEQRPMRGNNLVIQGKFTALFPKLVDHQKLRQVSSEFIAIQVAMEYTTTVHPGNTS